MEKCVRTFQAVVMVAGLLLTACVDNSPTEILVESSYVEVTVYSPLSEQVYSSPPELQFTATEGRDRQPVDLSRIAIVVSRVEGEQRVDPLAVEAVSFAIPLPDRGDGLFEIEIRVSFDSGEESSFYVIYGVNSAQVVAGAACCPGSAD